MGHIKRGTMAIGDALALVSLGDIILPDYAGCKDKPRTGEQSMSTFMCVVYVEMTLNVIEFWPKPGQPSPCHQLGVGTWLLSKVDDRQGPPRLP